MLFTSLLIVFARFGFGWAALCDNVLYTREGDLCYGVRDDKSTDECVDVPTIGYINAMAVHPLTDEVYIIALDDGVDPYYDTTTVVQRYFMRFTYDLAGGLSVSTPVQIGDVIPASPVTDIIGALAFTCQGVPRLFGLSVDYSSETTQYLYEIDYEGNGTLTEYYSWTISGDVDGFGLFYHIENERFYRITGSSNPQQSQIYLNGTEVNVFDNVVEYTYISDTGCTAGLTLFASYYNETHFFAACQPTVIVFTGSLDNGDYISNGAYSDFRSFGDDDGDWINSFQCADYTAICRDTFSAAPSNEPSDVPTNTPTSPTRIPSNVPSDNPSKMPSTQPSVAPSNYPTLPSLEPSMMPSTEPSTEPSLEPSRVPSNEPSVSPSDFPTVPSLQPSVLPSVMPVVSADDMTTTQDIGSVVSPKNMSTTPDRSYASKNTYNFIILLIAPIIYLFY